MANLELEVQYIRMAVGGTGHEHIEHIGGNTPQWERSRSEAISELESGRVAYYVKGTLQKKVYVYVVKPTVMRSTWYLKTQPDGLLGNNLLSLPRYPSITSQNALSVLAQGLRRGM